MLKIKDTNGLCMLFEKGAEIFEDFERLHIKENTIGRAICYLSVFSEICRTLSRNSYLIPDEFLDYYGKMKKSVNDYNYCLKK